MKITSQEEYGLRCLLQLARTPQGQIVSVKEIGIKEGLSSAYVEKLLRILSKTGLVHSVRGLKGGYVLNRPPSAVTPPRPHVSQAVHSQSVVSRVRSPSMARESTPLPGRAGSDTDSGASRC